MRAWVLMLALTLGGCSASEIVQNQWTSAPITDLSQPNHRGIIADNIRTIFTKDAYLGEMEIAGLRPVDHLQGPAWITCLKIDARGSPHTYAIFIKDGKIIETRAGIMIDGCQKETYTPFDLPNAPIAAKGT